MRKFHARGVWMTLGLCILTTSVFADDFGSPSLLNPQYGNSYPIAPVAYGRMTGDDMLPSPSDNPAGNMGSGMEYGNGYDGSYDTYSPPPVPAAPAPCGSDYQDAMSANWGDGCGCTAGSCGGGMGSCGRGGWFGYAGGLIMTRAQTGGMPLAYENYNQVLNTNQVEQQWMGGFEAAFGKWFKNGCAGVEVVYWGLFPTTQSYDYSGTNINSAIDFMGLQYDAGAGSMPLDNYWDGAQRQYIRRTNTFNNVELNLIGNAWNFGGAGYGGGNMGCCDTGCCNTGCGGCCNNLTVGWLAGVRYFNFNDNFWYASSTNDTVLDNTPDEVFYANNVKNQLVGFQLGGYMSYQIGCRWSLYGGAKAGIFNNHSSLYKRLWGTNGDADIWQGPYAGNFAVANASANNLAALGQLDMGIRYQATCNFAVRAGYRIVGVSGVALSDNQFLYDYRDLPAYSNIDTNGSLILHGAYAGGEFCW